MVRFSEKRSETKYSGKSNFDRWATSKMTTNYSASSDDVPLFHLTSAVIDNDDRRYVTTSYIRGHNEGDRHHVTSMVDTFDRYASPLWYFIGMPGNIVAYVVWIQSRLRHSSGFYLAALAINDFCFLVLHIRNILMSILLCFGKLYVAINQMLFELQIKWNITLLQLPLLCETFPVVFLATQYLNTLLVLGFTVERYIAVCHPFRRDRYCTTRRAAYTIGGLVFLSLALHSVQSYFWKYYPPTAADGSSSAADLENVEDQRPESAASGGQCRVRPEVMDGGMMSIWSIWAWLTELTVFGVVQLAILALNLFVIAEMRRLSAFERQLRPTYTARPSTTSSSANAGKNSGQSHVTQNQGSQSAATVTLLAVSFYLIFTTLPVTVCYVLYLGFPEGDSSLTLAEQSLDPTWVRHHGYRTVRTTVEELAVSKYACNFFIYLLTGTAFRLELRRIVSSICDRCSADRLDVVNGNATPSTFITIGDGTPSRRTVAGHNKEGRKTLTKASAL